MRGQKGITIVALIITIIVMVILAGVAIATAVLDGGILQQSRNAQKEHEAGKELEKVKLAVTEASLSGGDVITEDDLIEALDENFGREEYSLNNLGEYFELTIIDSGRKYHIYPNGRVEGPIGGDAPLGKAEVGIIVKTNSTIDGKEYSSTNPLIPAGFKAVNVGGTWDAPGGPEVDEGLVIRDENDNEFVWVPVNKEIDVNGYGLNSSDKREPDVITGDDENSYDAVVNNLIKAGCIENPNDSDTVLTADDFKVQLTNEYKAMAKSVNKYGGFYVGRFETSKNGEKPQSRRATYASGSGEKVSPVVSDWYDLYALNEKYSTSTVQGSMMWGSQYDAMMIWMGSSADSVSSINTTTLCGNNSSDVIKNVYDIYGSCREITLEANENNYRIVRGGSGTSYSYGSVHGSIVSGGYRPTVVTDFCAPNAYANLAPNASTIPFGTTSIRCASRLALYIK